MRGVPGPRAWKAPTTGRHGLPRPGRLSTAASNRRAISYPRCSAGGSAASRASSCMPPGRYAPTTSNCPSCSPRVTEKPRAPSRCSTRSAAMHRCRRRNSASRCITPSPGQWSILRGQRGESVAIAGEADTFEHAMVEAAALLADGAPAVVVVVAEELPAPAYNGWIDDVPFSYTLALRVSLAGGGRRWRLSLEENDRDAAPADMPHALRFVRAMHDGAPLDHPWKARRWTWATG